MRELLSDVLNVLEKLSQFVVIADECQICNHYQIHSGDKSCSTEGCDCVPCYYAALISRVREAIEALPFETPRPLRYVRKSLPYVAGPVTRRGRLLSKCDCATGGIVIAIQPKTTISGITYPVGFEVCPTCHQPYERWLEVEE